MIDFEKIVNNYMWENGKLTTVEQGKRFLDFILLKLFDRTEIDLENNDLREGVLYTDGSKDFGVDCSFVDGDVLYIIQSKYRDLHSYDNVYFFQKQIEQFLNLVNAKNIRIPLVDVYNALHDDEINEIKIFYITNNWLYKESSDHEYEFLCDEFNGKYSEKFEKNVSLQIIGYEDYYRIHTGILLELPKSVKTAKSTLLLARHFENRDKTTVVAEVALKDLARLVSEHKNYIFFSNIRNYKGLNSINKGIKETYENHPKNFWYFNNGITIVCNDYVLIEQQNFATVEIRAPQIVNGCQTATTIYNCWNAANKQDKENIDGTILVKIIQDSKSDKRKNITKYTNSQTAVSGKDFFALDSFHTELQHKFKEIGYFYEIQSNSTKALKTKYPGCDKYRHLFDVKFNKVNAITAKEITQIYIATLLKMPAKAKNIGQFMPGNEKYEQVYNDKTPIDPRFYLLPYGVWYYLKKVYQLPKNNIIDKDKWSASLLYITYVFFNVIDKKYNLENYEFISENFINLCDEKICNVDTFYKLVKTTYNIMRDFYNDYMIKKIIGDNLPKFLKASIETNTNVQEILMDKIKGNIEFDS